jgi:ATP-dependent helicase HrpB
MTALPIDDVIPEIRASLADANRLVLAAPPGAGKTTRAPLALLDESWLDRKKILLLEPRRIAARMAADRMAATLGEKTGGIVGLTTRVDRKVSDRTRIEVITDGLFTRRILSDPELSGVGTVLFDEFHERSINLDLGLALALDAQEGLRPDLRIAVMSATLETARIAKAIAAPVIESDGRIHPVTTVYLGRSGDRIEDQAARAARRALGEQPGSILVFLPGRGEILRTAERLDDLGDDIIVAPLYGALSPADQDRAVSPAPPGMRKIVLSTDIAESSLTIEGVNTVIDAGLARVAEFDSSSASPTLTTRRAARANVDQRRGRAGRMGPGVCYRLWDEEATRGLPAEPTPEILAANLAGLLLSLAEWGERDAGRLTWIDAPPAGRLAAARKELRAFGAIDDEGSLTARGSDMASLPLEPRLAAMIAGASDASLRALAAEIAALISERGLGGDSTDLRDRLERFRRDGSARAKSLRDQASRWAKGAKPAPVEMAGRAIAEALPLTIARAKPGEHGHFLLASGRAAQIDKASPLAGEEWLAVADMTGSAANARILAAAPLSENDALKLGGVETIDTADFDVARRTFKARRVKRLGAIILSETPLPAPSGETARAALIDALRRHGLDLLENTNAIRETQARIALAREKFRDDWPDFSDAILLERADEWLTPLLGEPPSLSRPSTEQLRRGLLALLDWSTARILDEIAPLTIATPAGRQFAVDYLADGGPLIEARVQEFFGLAAHPAILRGNLPVTVSLLSPARRQIALTKDLPAFWRGGYRDMAKDMRSQYPKHDWPDDPSTAAAHEGKTKARLKPRE